MISSAVPKKEPPSGGFLLDRVRELIEGAIAKIGLLRLARALDVVALPHAKRRHLRDCVARDPGSRRRRGEPTMQIEAMIRAVQRALGITVDGLAGPETWGAIYGELVGTEEPADIALNETGDRTNARSEAVIATLLPQVQPYARALFFKARDHGIAINIISGLRTYAEQDALYAKGRTAPGRKVTNARGGYSNHNFGIAFDIGVFEGSRYLPSSSKYKAVGVLGQELGLEWGGNWKTIVDQPHFQLRPGWSAQMNERNLLAELRNRKSHGDGVFA
jgi:peptidoglycan L-alanyl-D-glutamate endopeptidase CwlK